MSKTINEEIREVIFEKAEEFFYTMYKKSGDNFVCEECGGCSDFDENGDRRLNHRNQCIAGHKVNRNMFNLSNYDMFECEHCEVEERIGKRFMHDRSCIFYDPEFTQNQYGYREPIKSEKLISELSNELSHVYRRMRCIESENQFLDVRVNALKDKLCSMFSSMDEAFDKCCRKLDSTDYEQLDDARVNALKDTLRSMFLSMDQAFDRCRRKLDSTDYEELNDGRRKRSCQI